MNDLSPEARALLRRVAPGDEPTRADRDRVLGLVVAATAAPVVGDGGLSGGSAVAAGGTLKLVVLFAVSVGVGGVATTAATRAMRAPAPAPAPIVAPRPAPVAAPALAPPPAPEPVIAAVPAPDAPPTTTPKPVPAPRKVEPTPEIPAAPPALPPLPRKEDPCSLSAELQVVQQAQQALSSRPADAIATLDRFAGTCPSGTLIEERLATRGLALCLDGQRDEGRVAADALAERFPRSSALARVRQACGQ